MTFAFLVWLLQQTPERHSLTSHTHPPAPAEARKGLGGALVSGKAGASDGRLLDPKHDSADARV